MEIKQHWIILKNLIFKKTIWNKPTIRKSWDKNKIMGRAQINK